MSRNFSIGELSNMVQGARERKKAIVGEFIKKFSTESKKTLVTGYKIVFYGFCSSLVVYMIVKAFTLAL